MALGELSESLRVQLVLQLNLGVQLLGIALAQISCQVPCEDRSAQIRKTLLWLPPYMLRTSLRTGDPVLAKAVEA